IKHGPGTKPDVPFTPRAKRLLEHSWSEARRLGHNYIGTEHLLLGLIRGAQESFNSTSLACRVLKALDVDLIAMEENMMRSLEDAGALHKRYDQAPSPMPFASTVHDRLTVEAIYDQMTDEAINCIKLSIEEARRSGCNFVGSEHLLLGLIKSETSIAAQALKFMGV